MKTKKLLSLITAAAISASCFVGMAVSVSADTESIKSYTPTAGTYSAGDIVWEVEDVLTLQLTNDITVTTDGSFSFRSQLGSNISAIIDPFDGTITGNDNTTSLVLNANVDGEANFSINATGNRSVMVFDNTIGEQSASFSTTQSEVTETIPVKFNAEAGHQYIIYNRKWTGAFTGATYTYTTSSSGEGGEGGETEPDPTPVAEVSVSLDQTELSLYTKESKTLTATVTGASDTSVTWSTENKDIAEVTDGVVKGGAYAGETTITATSVEDPTKSATCKVTVTKAPSLTGTAGTVEDLAAATETTTYNFLTEVTTNVSPLISENAVYNPGNLYFNNEVYVVGGTCNGLLYYSNKTTSNLDETTQKGGIRLKNGQDVFAVKLAAGATIEIPVYGGGGGDREAVIGASADIASAEGALATSGNVGTTNGSSPKTLSYTNETGAEQVIYVTATGDSFFSQVKVTVPETPSLPDDVTITSGTTYSKLEGDAASVFSGTVTAKGLTFTTVKATVTLGDGQTKDGTANFTEISGDGSIDILVVVNKAAEDIQSVVLSVVE